MNFIALLKRTTVPATLIICLIIFSACINSSTNEEDISDSLDPIEDVVPIAGTESTTILVNKGSDAYFTLEFSEIQQNEVIANGFTGEGWCIDWKVPIESDGTTYSNIPLYSTFNVESWYPLNYLFNIMDDLYQADPDLTYREIQAVVWSLRGLPEFNLEAIPDQELPSRLQNNGQANFSREKVATILEIIESGYQDFDFTEGTRYAVIAETPADVQSVITVVE